MWKKKYCWFPTVCIWALPFFLPNCSAAHMKQNADILHLLSLLVENSFSCHLKLLVHMYVTVVSAV